MAPENRDVGSAGQDGLLPVFPFFIGCARSGTTLFRAIFTSHHDLVIPDETRYFSAMVGKRQSYERPMGFDSARFVKDIFSHPSPPRWIREDEVRGALAGVPPAGYADAVRRVYGLYAARSGKSRYGDKTPLNTLMVEALAESFPESRFVHIIRDGRDVAMSLMDRRFGQGHIVEAARHWRRHVQAGRAAGRRVAPARYREVRYEALLDDPEGTVRELCDFIDLPFEPGMLQYHEREVLLEPRPDDPRGVRGGRFHLPPTKGLRDWRSQMSKRELTLFEVAAGDLLDELGYERGVKRMPWWTVVGARIRTTRVDALFTARRLNRRLSP